MNPCPVCGKEWLPDTGLEIEEETYLGGEGSEVKMRIGYCNIGKDCNAVHAANLMDKLVEPFKEAVGEPNA
jgi:hypothetical protein